MHIFDEEDNKGNEKMQNRRPCRFFDEEDNKGADDGYSAAEIYFPAYTRLVDFEYLVFHLSCRACEENECIDYMNVTKLSGMPAVECIHLQQCAFVPKFPSMQKLSLDNLNMLSGEELKVLTDSTILQCQALHESASSEGCNLIAAVKDGERFVHFSVFDGGVHFYAKLGRVAVTADLHKGSLDCRCCSRKRGCIHKAICKWYLYENNSLNEFWCGDCENEDVLETQSEKAFAHIHSKIYPPENTEIVEKMCRYLFEQKKIPLDFAPNKAKKLSTFIPKEKTCHFCNTLLDSPRMITKQASVLMMDALLKNVQTFYSLCPNCGVCYRYQEFEDNIHNFSDTFLISLEVCIFLRNCLKEHIPIGSIVKVMETKIGATLNSQIILNAYLHFEALSNHSYSFNCGLCGFHPKILIMDLNKKIAFQCPAETLQLPDDYTEDDYDRVDADKFWNNIEMAMILRGFPGRKVAAFTIEPSLLNWAPYVGKNTRSSHLVYNTEHRKVQRRSNKLEKDCREITEERILEMLSQSSAKEVKKFAKNVGATATGSKLDIIINIKKIISQDEEKFAKIFSKIWGCSGGWVSGTCPHGIVYVLKFVLRAESPRDYVDLLLSMKHQPNVCIVDMAHMVVAHGKKRKTNMFHPYDGMVAEPTKENIAKAREGDLLVSLAFLEQRSKTTELESEPGDDVHPISASNMRLCLFDRFHEKNTKKEAEVLRRITHIEQLHGFLNTQRDEQLHASYRYDSRFLNSMKPENHIFLFRALIDLKNENVNEEKLAKIKNKARSSVFHDEHGRIIISKNDYILEDCVVPASNPNPFCEAGKKRKHESKRSTENCSPPVKKRASGNATSSESNNVNEHEETIITIDDSNIDPSVLSLPTKEEQFYWNSKLFLKNSDKSILSGSNFWVNDTIINAAMMLLKTGNEKVSGFQDVVVAQSTGFCCDEKKDKFIQILNIHGNHWVTISNVFSESFRYETNGRHIRPVVHAKVYDSLINASYKQGQVKYPLHVVRSICELTKPAGMVELEIANVQQQIGGNDCGLFAIAYAACLNQNVNPCSLLFDQEGLRQALSSCFVNNDISTLVEVITKGSRSFDEPSLHQQRFQLYCHCRLPDDGNIMVECKHCKGWFHEQCETGDFSSKTWRCMSCRKIQEHFEQKKKPCKGLFEMLIHTAQLHQKETVQVQNLYEAIRCLLINEYQLPERKSIGCLSEEEMMKIFDEKKKPSNLLGLTISFTTIPDVFICIMPSAFCDKKTLLETVVHEMAHALHTTSGGKGSFHGKEFKKFGMKIISKLKKSMHTLPMPFCTCITPQKQILNKK